MPWRRTSEGRFRVPDITLVIVNYFSAALARAAISSARATTRSPLRVILVDNSVDEREADELQSAGADELIVSPHNSGYSGGGNLGVAAARSPVVVVSNPDVVFGESCLDLLAERVGGDVAVAGPAFHWDRGGRWLLPPADLLTAGEKLSQAIAATLSVANRSRGRARLRRRLAFWRRAEPGPIEAVSGAVMAIDRRRFETVGGFDARFALYFEEIDLVRRLRARGGAVWYVPEARCRHIYNQSAAVDPGSGAKFLRSEAIYLRRWAPFALPLVAIARNAGRLEDAGAIDVAHDAPIALPSPDREWLVEATPLASFESAVGCLASGPELAFPGEVWSDFRSPTLHVRMVDPVTLEVVRRYTMRK